MKGHFTAEAYNEQARSYVLNNDVSIQVTVDEVFDNDHRVVSQRTSASGKFTFSAADAGEHRICFTAFNAPSSGWLLGGAPNQGGVKFKLDMAIGETSQIESTDKEHVNDITSRIRDLNGRLNDIRREQVFQRVSLSCAVQWRGFADGHAQEREAEFRDLSESVNSRVVRWTVIQLVVLGVTCAWQLSYLRAFFIKQKLT